MPAAIPQKSKSPRYKPTKVSAAITKSKKENIPDDHPIYKCTACGTEYRAQKGNFYPSKSSIYEFNNGYTTVCKDCAEGRYKEVLEAQGGREDKAVMAMCMLFDWYYSPAAFNYAVAARTENQTMIAAYVSKTGLPYVAKNGTSYVATLKAIYEEDSKMMSGLKELEELNRNENIITEDTIRKWGAGYTPDEYKLLDTQFEALAGKIIEGDDVSETIVKDLCKLKVLQTRAENTNDFSMYVKYQKLYTDTLKSPDLRSTKTKAGATDAQASWGKFIEMVEKYTPAEYYKDDKMFDDASGIKDYINRFFVRPFKNFFTGSSEQDPEYSVKREDVESDG